MGAERNELLALFAVPAHVLGPPPELDSRWQRGSVELAHAEAFRCRYGIDVSLSSEALDVKRWRWRRESGVVRER